MKVEFIKMPVNVPPERDRESRLGFTTLHIIITVTWREQRQLIMIFNYLHILILTLLAVLQL